MRTLPITIAAEPLAAFCQRNHTRRLALFGSVLRPDFRPDSDGDVLVRFAEGETPSLFGIVRMERELSSLLGGRTIDLRPRNDLSRYFRDQVEAEAVTVYVA